MKSINDVAKAFGLSRNTIINMIGKKKIKAIKYGKQWRISEEEYERMKKEGIK